MHNDYLVSLFLGIVEGITEFLPISSTAHLRIAEQLFDLPLREPYWKLYTVVIQLGAVLCLPVYFRAKIARLLRSFFTRELRDPNPWSHPLVLVMVAFVVTAIPSWLLTKQIGENLDSFYVIGASLLIGGAVMWGVDILCTAARVTAMDQMNLPQAIWIGACQILSAVFPGTSRSMATIAAGQVVSMSRESALEFSFFLSMPTMFVASAYALLKALRPGKAMTQSGIAAANVFSPGKMTGQQWIILAIGFVVSFFVAWAVVAWFMAWVRRRGFAPFAIYRIALGILVLIWARQLAAQPA